MTGALAAVALALALAAAGPRQEPGRACPGVVLRRAKPMMGTIVTVTARGCAAAELEERVREAFAEGARLSAMLSEWDPASPVSSVNAHAGLAPVRVPPELYEVLRTALGASTLTSGRFDVTWAPLGAAWRFDVAPPPRLPPRAEVERLRSLVDYRRLALDPAARTAHLERAGMRIGLGGIAKGYVAEAMADLLARRGIRDVMVAASGDISARGRNGDRPWTVAVRDPRDRSRARAVAELHDESISTSGDYERFFVVEGRRWHHIIDPETGYPARGTASVTVIAPHGALADALATGLLVLGPERGTAVARGIPNVAALFVADGGEERAAGGRRFAAIPRIGTGASRQPRRRSRHRVSLPSLVSSTIRGERCLARTISKTSRGTSPAPCSGIWRG